MKVAHLPLGRLPDFERASRKALEYLHGELGMGLWMVTRAAGNDWIVLSSEDHGYAVAPGDVFVWSDSFCSRMVQGEGPRLAAASDEVPAYREAPIASQIPIGSYIGVPLQAADGELFGTLCAIEPSARRDLPPHALSLTELLADLLSGILSLELRVAEAEREAERAQLAISLDELTGLYNRRGWELLVEAEEDRCRRHGGDATVFSIDLDGLTSINDSAGHTAGDDLLRRCAAALRAAVRGSDVAARLGGDEFGVLAVGADEVDAAGLADRIADAFESVGVTASIGSAVRQPRGGLKVAFVEADERMYRVKHGRRGRTPANAA